MTRTCDCKQMERSLLEANGLEEKDMPACWMTEGTGIPAEFCCDTSQRAVVRHPFSRHSYPVDSLRILLPMESSRNAASSSSAGNSSSSAGSLDPESGDDTDCSSSTGRGRVVRLLPTAQLDRQANNISALITASNVDAAEHSPLEEPLRFSDDDPAGASPAPGFSVQRGGIPGH